MKRIHAEFFSIRYIFLFFYFLFFNFNFKHRLPVHRMQMNTAIFLVCFAIVTWASSAVHVDVPVSVSSGFGLSAPFSPDADPDFTGPIQNVTVAVGREAVLSCTVTDLGHYKVGWMKAEDQTILTLHTRVVTHNSRISVTHDNLRTWQLRIRQLKESDRGCYMCQINTNTMKKQVGCIDVQVPPDINDEETSSDLTVREGENATLVCRATGHPTPRILWRRENGEHLVFRKNARDISVPVDTFSGESLTLVKLDRKQMGAYLCIASNDVPPAVSKRITLNVNFAPIIKVPNQLLGAPLGTDVQLECIVEAYPNTVNYWVKNRGEMLLDGRKHVVQENRTGYHAHLMLTIRNFSKRDLGTYMCVATNSLGKEEGTVRLYEIKVQTTTPTTTTTTTTTTTPTTPIFTYLSAETSSRNPAAVLEQRSAIMATTIAPVEAFLEDPGIDNSIIMHPSDATIPQEYMENYLSCAYALREQIKHRTITATTILIVVTIVFQFVFVVR